MKKLNTARTSLPASFLEQKFPWIAPALPELRVDSASETRASDLWTDLPYFGLAVVGTRQPSRRATRFTHDVIRELAQVDRRFIIVSGLARGIDSEAHIAALDCGLRTVAVLGGGLDEIYPQENELLARDLMEQGGLVVSQYPDSSEPRRGQFIARNRIIAGLSRATWVVEAGEKSGAKNTAHWALQYGTDLYVTPTFPDDAHGGGNRILLQQGAHALWNAQSLRTTWVHLPDPAAQKSPATSSPLSWKEWDGLTILEAMKRSRLDAPQFFEWLSEPLENGSLQLQEGILVFPQTVR